MRYALARTPVGQTQTGLYDDVELRTGGNGRNYFVRPADGFICQDDGSSRKFVNPADYGDRFSGGILQDVGAFEEVIVSGNLATWRNRSIDNARVFLCAPCPVR